MEVRLRTPIQQGPARFALPRRRQRGGNGGASNIRTKRGAIDMSTLAKPPLDPSVPKNRVPPLHSGDRLTAEEFDRRYAATPEKFKAELIKGVVYVASPVTFGEHGGPHFDIIGWMAIYRIATPGIRGGDNTTIRLLMNNRPQPDACLIVDPRFGGRVEIVDRYIVGGPECIAEIAATSE